LIMAPTRELAMQIESDFRTLSFGLRNFFCRLRRRLPIMRQINELHRGVSFIIGTPGRLRDLIDRKVLDLSKCLSVVLDEADRMLDMVSAKIWYFYTFKMPEGTPDALLFSDAFSEIKKLTK